MGTPPVNIGRLARTVAASADSLTAKARIGHVVGVSKTLGDVTRELGFAATAFAERGVPPSVTGVLELTGRAVDDATAAVAELKPRGFAKWKSWDLSSVEPQMRRVDDLMQNLSRVTSEAGIDLADVPPVVTPGSLPPKSFLDVDLGEGAQRWINQERFPLVTAARAVSPVGESLARTAVAGAENVPANGAAILAPTHASTLDPWYFSLGHDRVPRSLAATINPPVDRIREAGGAFTVRRGSGGREALGAAATLLEKNQLVVMYPEGRRVIDGVHVGEARFGAAKLALDTGAPIIPAASASAKPAHSTGRQRTLPAVTVVYGEPLSFPGVQPTKDNVAAVTEILNQRMEALLQQAASIDRARAVAG